MRQEQKEIPILKALLKHSGSGFANLHVPAHRQGLALSLLAKQLKKEIFNFDLTELPGLDNLSQPHGPIAQAQELAAELYGAKHTFFLINGSTAGIEALLLALCRPGEKMIVPRDSHRSVLGGLILSGADPVYANPSTIPGFGIPAGIPANLIAGLLKKDTGIRGVLAIYPNYYGIAIDLQNIETIVHQAGKPLLVDEAHGAHLPFHPELPKEALSCGADAVVQSMHKMGGSLTQSSLLHLQENYFNPELVSSALSLLQTSSPSYLLLLSLDFARHQLAVHGRRLLDKSIAMAHEIRETLIKIPLLKVLTEQHMDEGYSLDPTRITVSGIDLGLTGYRLAGLLAEKYGVQVEMADYRNIVAVISIGTTLDDCRRFLQGLKEITRYEKRPSNNLPLLPEASPPVPKRLTPRTAWFSDACRIPLANCAGFISAEWVAVYPPGIPVICPGEEFTPEAVEYLQLLKESGAPIIGPADETMETLKVVRNQ